MCSSIHLLIYNRRKLFVVAGETAQSVKCLPHTHEDLSVTPRICIKVLGVVARAWNPSAGAVQTGHS